MRQLLRLLSKQVPVVASLVILFAALVLRVADPPGVARLRDFAFDTFQRLQPRAYDPQWSVRIVDIDDASLAAYGQWPWPRDRVARLVDKLTELGAAVIAFDVLFAEPDASSWHRRVRELVAYVDPETVQRIASAVQDNDRLLASAFAHSSVVTAYTFDFAPGDTVPPAIKHGYAISGEDPKEFLRRYGSATTSLALLEAGAKGNGAITSDIDISVNRRIPLLMRLEGKTEIYPALAMEATRVALGASTYIAARRPRAATCRGWHGSSEVFEQGVQSIQVGDRSCRPTLTAICSSTTAAIGRSGSSRCRTYSKAASPRDKIEGSIIFVGTSAKGLKDIRNTPVAVGHSRRRDTCADGRADIHGRIPVTSVLRRRR